MGQCLTVQQDWHCRACGEGGPTSGQCSWLAHSSMALLIGIAADVAAGMSAVARQLKQTQQLKPMPKQESKPRRFWLRSLSALQDSHSQA